MKTNEIYLLLITAQRESFSPVQSAKNLSHWVTSFRRWVTFNKSPMQL